MIYIASAFHLCFHLTKLCLQCPTQMHPHSWKGQSVYSFKTLWMFNQAIWCFLHRWRKTWLLGSTRYLYCFPVVVMTKCAKSQMFQRSWLPSRSVPARPCSLHVTMEVALGYIFHALQQPQAFPIVQVHHSNIDIPRWCLLCLSLFF